MQGAGRLRVPAAYRGRTRGQLVAAVKAKQECRGADAGASVDKAGKAMLSDIKVSSQCVDVIDRCRLG